MAIIRVAGIRVAGVADVAAIEAIVAAAYAVYVPRMGKKPGPMLDDYAARVRAHQVWVAEDGGEVAGLVVLEAGDGALLLDNVAVAPGRHGRGIGRALMAFAEAEAVRRGFAAMVLYTHVTMVENVAMSSHLGWEETGRGVQDGYDRVFFRKAIGRTRP